MEKRTILYNNESLKIMSNDIKIIKYIEEEFKTVYTFFKERESTIDKKIILLNNARLYDLYKDKIIKTIEDEEIIIIKEKRKVIVIYDKIKCNIIIIFKGISSTVLQYIGEVIFSIFGKEMEHKGMKFLHSAAVSLNNKGIALIGPRNIGKTTIMCELLQESFDFVSNSHVRTIQQK